MPLRCTSPERFFLHGHRPVGVNRVDHKRHRTAELAHIDVILHVQKITVRDAEIFAQAQRRIRRDLPSVMENVLNPGDGNVDGVGQLIGGDPHRFHEFFLQKE